MRLLIAEDDPRILSVKTKDENEKPIGDLSFPGRFLHAAQDGIGARRRAVLYRRHTPLYRGEKSLNAPSDMT